MSMAAAAGEDDDSLVFFVRSWFQESSRWAMLFWEGDQMVSSQANASCRAKKKEKRNAAAFYA
jgi:hypothetical protein